MTAGNSGYKMVKIFDRNWPVNNYLAFQFRNGLNITSAIICDISGKTFSDHYTVVVRSKFNTNIRE